MSDGTPHDTPARQRPGIAARLLHVIAALVCLTGWIVFLAWLIGRILTDRYDFSQWLWWLPTPIVLAVIALGVMGAFRRARRPRIRRRRIITWLILFIGIGLWFALVEHRFLRAAGSSDQSIGITIGHWNMSHPAPEDFPDYAGAALSLEADVLVLSSPSLITARPDLLDDLDANRTVHRYGIFSVVSTVDVLSGRPLVNREGIWSYMIELDTVAQLGRPLVVYMIDLPAIDYESPGSTFERSRMDLARQFRDLLDAADAPLPDVVIGDFNITRGSASIAHMFPHMTHAFDTGGTGYGATFHRTLPYAHIDHILLADWLTSPRYEIVNPGVGRHNAQLADVVQSDAQESAPQRE